MSKVGYVYILSNKNWTVLYIGVTSQLENRILQHKAGKGSRFTAKYSITDLLHFETHSRNGISDKQRKTTQTMA